MEGNLFVLSNAGFRSRVRYISILDPTNMCYYVSEIVDVGREGPLFMVIRSLHFLSLVYTKIVL